MKKHLILLCLLLYSATLHANIFSLIPGRYAHRDYFELDKIARATAPGGNKPLLDRELTGAYWQRTDLFGHLPRLLETYGLWGRKTAFQQADALAEKGLKKEEILSLKLAVSSIRGHKGDVERFDEQLGKSDVWLVLFTRINWFLEEHSFLTDENETMTGLREQAIRGLENARYTTSEKAFLRLALCDLRIESVDPPEDAFKAIDSLWKVHPDLLVPGVVEIMLHDLPEYAPTCASAKVAMGNTAGRSQQVIELLTDPKLDYNNPRPLLQLIADSPDDEKELIRVLALYHTREKNRYPSFGLPYKEEKRRFPESVKTNFKSSFTTLAQWNALATKVLEKPVAITEEQLSAIRDKAGYSKEEAYLAVFGTVFYETAMMQTLESRLQWITPKFGKQSEPTAEEKATPEAFLEFLSGNPFYQVEAGYIGLEEQREPGSDYAFLLFDNMDDLLRFVAGVQEIEAQYPASIALKHTIMATINYNLIDRDLGDSEQAFRILAHLFVETACLNDAVESTSDALYRSRYDKALSYTQDEPVPTIFERLDPKELNMLRAKLEIALEENPGNTLADQLLYEIGDE